MMYYAAKIISMAGYSDNTQAIWMSAGVASVNFLCTFVGLFLVERIGRRKLLLISLFGVVLSLAFLAVGFQIADLDTPPVTFNETENSFCSAKTDCRLDNFQFIFGIILGLKRIYSHNLIFSIKLLKNIKKYFGILFPIVPKANSFRSFWV